MPCKFHRDIEIIEGHCKKCTKWCTNEFFHSEAQIFQKRRIKLEDMKAE